MPIQKKNCALKFLAKKIWWMVISVKWGGQKAILCPGAPVAPYVKIKFQNNVL